MRAFFKGGLIFMSVLLSLYGCNSANDRDIPSDVVTIPNSADGKENFDKLPVMTFEKTSHDFGRIIDGEIVSYSFKFRNTGKSDLLISNISASCGCTATQYTKEPIKPGGEGFVKVSFNSAGKQGFQHKTVTVTSNTQPPSAELSVKAQVQGAR